MEAPSIQLYNLFRHDLSLSDGKSLELMHLLEKEYKYSVREDIAALSHKIDGRFGIVDDRFARIDARFDKVDERFEKIEDILHTHDKRFDALDSKIDIKTAELRTEIRSSHVELTRWMFAIILNLLLLFIGMWMKK